MHRCEERSSQGVPPLDPVNSTAAAVYQFATPQRVRRTLPELSRSRGFKQAKRFAFCPSGQKCPHAHAVSVSSFRLGLSPRLTLRTTYRLREKPPGAFSLAWRQGLSIGQRRQAPQTSGGPVRGLACLQASERTNCLSRREAVRFCAPRRTDSKRFKKRISAAAGRIGRPLLPPFPAERKRRGPAA